MPSTAAYRVKLDAYAGPLDLLLYLVKRHEIDLSDIPIAQLTEQYLEHLKLIEKLDIELAGEFLVMAATLLEIKSLMLVPPAQADGESDEAIDGALDGAEAADPRFELVKQLLAYKRFKDAALNLDQRKEQWSLRYASQPKTASDDPDAASQAAPIEFDLEDVHVLDLCQAFARILDSVGQNTDHQVTYDDTPLALHAEDVFDRLQREGPLTLQQIFEGRDSRSAMIGLFLAMLELVRDRRIRVLQDRLCGEIRLEACDQSQWAKDEDEQQAEPNWRDPQTGEVDYDWPDPEAKQRSEKRAKIRAQRLAKLRSGPVDEGEPVEEDDELIELNEDVLDEDDGRISLAEHHHEADDSELSADDELIPDDDPN